MSICVKETNKEYRIAKTAKISLKHICDKVKCHNKFRHTDYGNCQTLLKEIAINKHSCIHAHSHWYFYLICGDLWYSDRPVKANSFHKSVDNSLHY